MKTRAVVAAEKAELLGLPPSVLTESRARASDLPYHNFEHCLTVAINADHGATFYGLSNEERSGLFVAGLCHDIGYRLTVTETENIQRAIELAAEFVPRELMKDVQRLVLATTYPHIETSRVDEQIIQDADLMQKFEPDGETFTLGLVAEGVKLIEGFPSLSMFSTEWGRMVWHRNNSSQ